VRNPLDNSKISRLHEPAILKQGMAIVELSV